MGSSDEWVEEVRRWCATGAVKVAGRMPVGATDESSDAGDIGYEAAQPLLQNLYELESARVAGGERL
ncbi:MAG: hypothetical protein JWQ11_2496 [Rhizobacter sp.]|nr:hypothetical protein [Rhizobacter sp.]